MPDIPWPNSLDLLAEEITGATSANEMSELAKRLREFAEAADLRAVELALREDNFIMSNASARVQ